MHILTGFVVVDRAGEFLAWAEDIVTAIRRLRGDPLGARVERCSDSEVMSFRYIKKGKPDPWAEAVAA